MRLAVAFAAFAAASLPLAPSALATQDQNTWGQIGGGVSYPMNSDTRDRLDRDYGWNAMLGLTAPQQAFFGFPWIDVDWAHVARNEQRLDSVGITYCERVPLGQRLYLGAGVGSFYNDLRLVDETTGEAHRTKKWQLGGKAVLGLDLSPRLFVEAGYFYSRKLDGLDTAHAALSAGFRF